MESVNSFSQGMSSDISKVIHEGNSYVQALNFRPLTELGGSNGSLVNIKGNECKLTFPDIQALYKMIVVKGSDPSTPSNTISFTINSQTHGGFNMTNDTLGVAIYNFIITNFTNCYQNTTVATKTFSVAYDDNYIIFYQQPVYQDCTTVASVATTITTTYTELTTGAYPVLNFTNGNSIYDSLTQDVAHPYISGVASSLVVPIGSTFIMNEVYIFTATDNPAFGLGNGPNPLVELPENDSFTFDGAIWKLTIDDVTKQHTITLLYSNHLDFTKYHPIPPSATSGRYESGDIKRVYWSDNYNKIRTLNIANKQLMALSPSILNVIPKVEFTQGTLNSIIAGNLDTGCFQAGYRLSKVLGSVTNFSELSNPVYITNSPESNPFQDYEADGGGTVNKGIVWSFNNLDTNYDQIEFIVAFRPTASSTPIITAVGVVPLSPSMTFTYVNAGTVDYTIITLEEFLLFSGTFTHAKTCDTKDNRLFWGNVRSLRKSLDSFDARAFRATDTGVNAGSILLKHNGVSTSYTTVALAAATDVSTDAINEYYDSSGNNSANACYLKPSTALTTKVLGGEGLNISYEFGTESINSDNNFSISSSDAWEKGTPASPYRSSDATVSNPTGLIYNYPQNGKFQALKQPERTSLLRGFQHEEIYRFGIQFFDKEGNPYFTSWIGDIKMPSYGDTNSNPDAQAISAGISDFRLSYSSTYSRQYQQVLYIKFTVNVSSIQDLIGGYEMVRVKREGTNKTIWGVGMINPIMPRTGNDATDSDGMIPAGWNSDRGNFVTPLNPGGIPPLRYYTPYPSQFSVETLNINNDTAGANTNFGKFKMFDCWDMDFGERPTYANGDKILIRSQLKATNYRGGTGAGIGDTSYRISFGDDNFASSGLKTPANNVMIDDLSTPPFTPLLGSNCDMGNADDTRQRFNIFKMLDNQLYCDYTDFLGTNTFDHVITEGKYLSGNTSDTFGGYTIFNYADDIANRGTGATGNPCYGKQSLFLHITNGLYTSDAPYNCFNGDADIEFKKLLALYYKPNVLLYGGPTYTNRTNNVYIPCSEYITTVQNNIPVNVNTLTFKCFGGDTFTGIYDMQKTVKGAGAEYHIYRHNSSGVFQAVTSVHAKFSSSFFFPTTGKLNVELRGGDHINKNLNSDAGLPSGEEQYIYIDYANAENDIKTYFPKPLNFQTNDEWINRVYFSEIKFNNELQDSWSEYLTNSFYDVEGNYGPINALISLKDNMYYIQERGVGMLMINPVSMINDQLGTPIKLGASNDIIQKHYYKSIDSGTSHQWSVYRSQSTITFVDARHKKIYLFNGESVSPISDIKGQRNFTIKRLHTELLKYDNPVINKGILVTYDYYNNEFLYTFNNVKATIVDQQYVLDTVNNENLTLAYSEVSGNFSGLYSFTPNLYINSNKYLISTKNLSLTATTVHNKLWFHNYGTYANFYGTQYPSTLKFIVNDQPLYTKVFDNLTMMTEAVDDNVEWSDDLNIYPGSPTSPSYPDDVNVKDSTFDKIRVYNEYQNTDWTTLDITTGGNIRKVEQGFNLQLPRNKFNYDVYPVSTSSIFDPSKLTKTTFGDRLRDKWVNIDLSYNNLLGLRFVVHNIKTLFRISDR